jgi:hypothetical protein
MRRQIAFAAALTLAAVALSAQVRSPEPSHSVVALTDIKHDSASRVASSELFTSLQALRRAEDAYYGGHRHYTADRIDLPGYRPPAGANVFVTAGADWMAIRGEVNGVTIQQITVWRSGQQGVMSGAFSTE